MVRRSPGSKRLNSSSRPKEGGEIEGTGEAKPMLWAAQAAETAAGAANLKRHAESRSEGADLPELTWFSLFQGSKF